MSGGVLLCEKKLTAVLQVETAALARLAAPVRADSPHLAGRADLHAFVSPLAQHPSRSRSRRRGRRRPAAVSLHGTERVGQVWRDWLPGRRLGQARIRLDRERTGSLATEARHARLVNFRDGGLRRTGNVRADRSRLSPKHRPTGDDVAVFAERHLSASSRSRKGFAALPIRHYAARGRARQDRLPLLRSVGGRPRRWRLGSRRAEGEQLCSHSLEEPTTRRRDAACCRQGGRPAHGGTVVPRRGVCSETVPRGTAGRPEPRTHWSLSDRRPSDD